MVECNGGGIVRVMAIHSSTRCEEVGTSIAVWAGDWICIKSADSPRSISMNSCNIPLELIEIIIDNLHDLDSTQSP